MEKEIIKFCQLLQKCGIFISSSQITNALKAVTIVGFNREDFYQALYCTLVTQQTDSSLFYRLFCFYFSSDFSSKPKNEKGEEEDGEQNSGTDKDKVELIQNTAGLGIGESEKNKLKERTAVLLAQAVKNGDYTLLYSLAQLAVNNLGKLHPQDRNNIDNLVEKAKKNIGWEEAVSLLFPPVF